MHHICWYVVQLPSHVQLFVTPWTVAHQPYLSFIIPPRVCSNSCPLSPWCHSTISSSVVPFSSCLQFSQHQSLFQCQLFASGGQSIRASASVLPLTIQGWFPLGLPGLISLLSQGFSRVFSSTTVWWNKFFSTQPFSLSCSYIYVWQLEKP